MTTTCLRAATLVLTFGLAVSGSLAPLANSQPLPSQPSSGQLFSGQARGPVQRICHGRVLDKAGAPIKGAIVYLRDERSTTIKSAISEEDGTYRFVQLVPGTDYDLWAQIDAKKSKTRNISSFDAKNDFTIDLSIER